MHLRRLGLRVRENQGLEWSGHTLDLGFRVYGLGFENHGLEWRGTPWIQGLGFRVYGLGFENHGLEWRGHTSGLLFIVYGLGFENHDLEWRGHTSGCLAGDSAFESKSRAFQPAPQSPSCASVATLHHPPRFATPGLGFRV
jgi:hypothetical protein